MLLERHNLADARGFENSGKLLVIGGDLDMRMCVRSRSDRNLEFDRRAEYCRVRILFVYRLAPAGRTRFDRETCFPRDLENRPKLRDRIVSVR